MQTARWDRSNFATLFDAANPDASVEKRDVSTVAPQALFLLNHDFVLAQAKHLAERVTRDEPKDETARIQRLFQIALRPAGHARKRSTIARQAPRPAGADGARGRRGTTWPTCCCAATSSFTSTERPVAAGANAR